MKKVLAVLVIALVPVVLLLTATRLLLTPAFVMIEYNMPGFPEDTYGMTKEQRLQYAPLALEYLLNDEDVSFLADQRFEDGTPLYNERELSHMVDVKVLTQQVMMVWLWLLAAFVGAATVAKRRGEWVEFRGWLARGGQLTVVLIVLLLVFVALSFNALFTGFHRIFFQGDSWLFLFSDTLIRLFPLRFWQDVFIALGGMTLLGGLALWRWPLRQSGQKKTGKKTKK
jgi:integral membrane protein (TIGR01906 family)